MPMLKSPLASPFRQIAHRPVSIGPLRSTLQLRSKSDISGSPSSKIRAAPFLLNQDVAVQKLRDYARIELDSEVMVWNPTYYPIWRVDVLLEKPAAMEGKEVVEGKAMIAVHNGHLPGNAYGGGPSSISYGSTYLPANLPLYNDKFHTARYANNTSGHNNTLPFTTSPIAAGKKVRETLNKIGDEAGDVEGSSPLMDEWLWKEKMLAFYPIYLPLYTAICTYKNAAGHAMYDIITLEAHDENVDNCKISAATLPEHMEPPIHSFLPNAKLFALTGSEDTDGTAMSEVNDLSLDKVFSDWLTTTNEDHLTPLDDMVEPIDWSDARIQDWEGPERQQNVAYYNKAVAGWKKSKQLDDMVNVLAIEMDAEREEGGSTVALSEAEQQQELKEQTARVDMATKVYADANALEAEMDEAKPAWLIQWDEAELAGRAAETSL